MWICSRCKKSLDDGYKFCWKCGVPKPAPSLPDEVRPSGHPDYALRFDTIENLMGEGRGKTKKILLAVAIFAIVLVAREMRLVNWYSYTFNSNHKVLVQMSGSNLRYTDGGERATYTESSKRSDYTGRSEDKASGVAFNTSGKARLADDFKELLQAELKNQERVSVYVTKVELDGMYMLPFYKSGHCKYQLHVQGVEADSITYSGNILGEVDFNITGSCSVRTVREILGKKIAEQAIEAVNNALK
jgi:hypothetical protein